MLLGLFLPSGLQTVASLCGFVLDFSPCFALFRLLETQAL